MVFGGVVMEAMVGRKEKAKKKIIGVESLRAKKV